MNTRTSRAMAVAGACLFVVVVGCTDLTVEPKSTVTEANVWNDPANYERFVAKLYGGLALTGQQGPAGNADIRASDEGFMSYTRLLFNLNELPADEVALTWGDAPVQELNKGQWGVDNDFIRSFYYRVFFQVTLANEFLYQSTDAQLDARGLNAPAFRADIQTFRAEARFLRALSYWHGLDFFGNIPLATEATRVGDPPPPQVSRDSMFRYIVSELTAIIPDLPPAGIGNQDRASQLAGQMLLAKVLLNHEVYTGTATPGYYAQAMTAVQAVIGGPFTLAAKYRDNFLADNHMSPEIIFAVTSDGRYTQSYGNTTFLVHAFCGGGPSDPWVVPGDSLGISAGSCWWGFIMRPEAFNRYAAGDTGRTSFFFTVGRTSAVDCLEGCFAEGIAGPKYANFTSAGDPGSDPNGYFVDTDFPLFRLADAYLIYAELYLRGGGGGEGQAVTYINALRQRSYGDASGDITGAELTLDFVLEERGRELYAEAQRRTDLVRFGRFGGSTYLWSWKGGVQGGAAIGDHRVLYPLPGTELTANPNLVQNPGY